jgi:hypothetical protein
VPVTQARPVMGGTTAAMPATLVSRTSRPVNPGTDEHQRYGFDVPMRDIITGEASVDHHRPRVFKNTGIARESLVIAAEVYLAG